MKITEQQKRIITNVDHTMSDKYVPIKTLDVVNRFKEHGMTVSSLQESRTRIPEKADKVRHYVRMRIDSDGDVEREVVIMNSSDGSTSLRLHVGALRLVCNNGLIISSDIITPERIKHTTLDPFARIDNFVTMLLSKLEEEKFIRESMQRKILLPYEIEDFTQRAVAIKEGDDYHKVLDPMAAAIARRPEDVGHDVWRVFNRVQENVIQGGSYRKLSIRTNEDGESEEKWTVAKIISDHERRIKVNEQLHSLAMEYI